MKKALIVYCSKTGITKRFAFQIEMECQRNGLATETVSIDTFASAAIADADYLFLGCWTHGWFVIFQRPEHEWVKFAELLPDLHDRKIVLFTTYKIATGSMFRKMRARLRCHPGDVLLELKSRDGTLSETNAGRLRQALGL